MKRLVVAAAVAVLLSGAAHADPFAAMYGNSVIITTPDGNTSKAYVNQDMTWEQRMADGSVLKGVFAWRDASTACFTQTNPPPKVGTAPNCAKIEEHKVGDTWTETDPKRQVTTFALTLGR